MGGILAIAAVGVLVYGMVQLLPTWVNAVILSVAALFVGTVFVAPQQATIFLGAAIVFGLIATIIALIFKFWAHVFGAVLGVLLLIGIVYGIGSFA